jgi:hypothetical protein
LGKVLGDFFANSSGRPVRGEISLGTKIFFYTSPSSDQGDRMSLPKIRLKCSPTDFSVKSNTMEQKVAQEFALLL